MNMVRIRHIMEMRRACKAPPLLPPKLRKEGSESTDRRGPKDVMDLTFKVNTLAPERYPSRTFYFHLYESQDSSEGPWNLITESDRLGTDDVANLEDFLAIEFSFERLQWFKMEISQIEIVCISEEEKEGVIGQAVVSMEVAKAMEPISIFNESYKQGRKPIGEVRICRYQQLRVCSFLDYLRGGTSLKFAIAIDFSIRDPANVTHNDYQQYSNDIEFVVRCLADTLEPFNPTNSWLSYGFGAKIPPHYRDSNNFCLSLDVDATCQGVNGILNAFGKSYQNVHPLQGAKFSQIIYHLAKQAQNNFNRANEPPNYYVLFIITRGSIEDLKETVQAAIFASKAPISIVFIPWQCSTFYMQNHVLPGKSSSESVETSSGGLTVLASSSSRRPSSAHGQMEEEEEARMRTTSSSSGPAMDHFRSRRNRLSTEMRSMTLDDSR
ncbi:Protein CBR-CPNA-4 [Caenorhabditis briggsae]|uniref:Protein CBR-CPNA-4 n=1 Tax=Caenorhabditis briggsae TaxID=6238 RepID=B0K090_CAEBR|nr:Protein CBR-CPNA-4 [Caenorhabditis briggsae]CAP32472.1 Protein CBR-CPNA-4 [Caenorhabditis briggsae]